MITHIMIAGAIFELTPVGEPVSVRELAPQEGGENDDASAGDD